MRALPLTLAAVAALGLAGCDANDPVAPVPLAATTVADLPADPTIGRDPTTGAPISTNRFTFFSLRDNAVVLRYDEADRADSATAAWDVAFRGTTILVNGGTSGPGQGGVQVLTATFDEVTEAPADGYRQDAAGAPAIPGGSGNGWYNYDAPTNTITPIPGRVLVVRTADGRYAKLRILSYYRGNPATVDPLADEARYFTFEYVFQPDGSRRFETTGDD